MTRKGAWGAGLAVTTLAAILLRLLLAGVSDTTPPALPVAPPPPPSPNSPVETDAPDADPPAPPSPLEPDAPAPPEPVVTKVTLEGRVVDIRDAGIEGAEVALYLGRDLPADPKGTLEEIAAGGLYMPVARGAVLTDARGGFRVSAPAGTVATVRARAPDHVPALLEGILFAEDREGVVLRLVPAEPFEGVVRSAAGQRPPIEGAEVRLLSGTERKGGTVLDSARTDAEGRFRFAAARWGSHSLLVTAPGYLPQFVNGVAVPLEVDRPYEISLWPPARSLLRGTVLHPRGVGTVAGAAVRIETRPGILPASAETVTDAHGNFSLEAEVSPFAQRHDLRIEVDAGDRGAAVMVFRDWKGDTYEQLVLEAAPSGVLRGKVVDVSPDVGRAGVSGVGVVGGGVWLRPVKRTAVTDAGGNFVLERMPDRKPWVALDPGEGKVVYAERFTIPEFANLPSGEVVLEVVPRRRRPRGVGVAGEAGEVPPEIVPASVSGAVLGPDGQMVPFARVWGFGPGAVIADARGAFVLRDVIAKERSVTLRAEAPGFQPGSAGPMGLFPELELRNVAIFLPAEVRGVVGKVLDSGGAPLRRARIKATPQPAGGVGARPVSTGYAVSTTTRADGSYRFEALAGSNWRIEAWAAGFRTGAIEGVPAGGPVPDLVLVPASAPTPR